MRYLFGFTCVLALGVMGCSETTGDGGTGGGGGTGGMPECQSPEDCDDDNECTDDTCLAGVCEFMPVPDPTGPEEPGDPPGEGTTCGYYSGTCEGGSCVGTFVCTEAGIREAIAAGAGPHTFACNGATTVVTEAEIFIDNDVILDGEGNLTVDGNESHRVFDVGRCFDLTMFETCEEQIAVGLHGIEVTRGLGGIAISQGVDFELLDSVVSENAGHGIYSVSERTLTVTNSTISGNECCTAPGTGCFCGGGGIFSGPSALALTDSTVSDNTAEGGGGISSGGVLRLVNSTVSGNVSRTWGGGMIVGEGTIVNSTVSGNTAMSGGGILHGDNGPLTIINSTISDNIADQGGSAITTFGERLTWSKTLIDGDCSLDPPEEVPGERVSLGFNIESPGDTCDLDPDPDGTDRVNVTVEQLNLGELADNGGPTMTHALLTEPIISVAIDVIPADDCVGAEGEPLQTDQRGEPRFVGPPLGPGEPVGDGCDVGSFERQPEDP